jgi:hypothetical protein
MQKVRNWINYDPKTDSTMEPVNKLPSMTEPDLTPTVQEMVERHNMGLPPIGERIAVYDEEHDIPDVSKMDLIDRARWIQHYDAEIQNLLTPKDATDAANKQMENDRQEKQVAEDAQDDLLIKD